jgi:hypothetical protein
MTEQQEEILTLLIIDKNKTLDISYWFCKMLSVRFKIIGCVKIMERLIDKEYATFREIEGLKYFTLTKKGEKIIKDCLLELRDTLKLEYPGEENLVNNLTNGLTT